MSESGHVPVPQVAINAEDFDLFVSVTIFVHRYMSRYDSSHDYQHVLRVVSNANRILQAETKANPLLTYDSTAIFLAALLHDVGDHKYAGPGEYAENHIAELLRDRGASTELAAKVHSVAKAVSFSNEAKNPEAVALTLQTHPELAIVQDADRLDAIGAVGIARCFSYNAAKQPGQPMSSALAHFDEKLYKLAGMMKTQSGKEMAQKRHKTLLAFARDWTDETDLGFEMRYYG